MKLIGSALGRHIDDGAVAVSELRVGVAGQNLYLFYRIYVGVIADQVSHGFIDVDAIEQKVVGLLAVSIDIGTPAGQVPRRRNPGRIGCDRARDQKRQRHEIPSVQRQLGGLLTGDRVAGLSVLGLKRGRGRRDFHPFRHLSDLEADILAHGLVDLQPERTQRGRLESAGLGRDVVVADRKEVQVIDARFGGLRLVFQVGVDLGRGNRHVRRSSAGRIDDGPGDGSSHGL